MCVGGGGGSGERRGGKGERRGRREGGRRERGGSREEWREEGVEGIQGCEVTDTPTCLPTHIPQYTQVLVCGNGTPYCPPWQKTPPVGYDTHIRM